jgi:hypothetical protein
MGKRDIRGREKKKPKKDAARKTLSADVLPSPVTVEVIKKGKKEHSAEE